MGKPAIHKQVGEGYAKLASGAQQIFAGWNHEKIFENFPDLVHDSEYIWLTFLSQPLKIERATGAVFFEGEGAAVPYDDSSGIQTIMDMLCSEKPFSLSGEWCPIACFSQHLAMGAKTETAFSESIMDAFSGNTDGSRAAFHALGGEEYVINKSADLSYKINLFDFFPVIVQFWGADEEFDAQLKTLWDKNTLDYLKFETVFFAYGCLMQSLLEQTHEHSKSLDAHLTS